MKRLLATALCLIPLAAAGCGGSSSSGAKSPLDEALGYLPNSAPLVVAIDTNMSDAQWQSLSTNVNKFPFSGQIESSLKSSLSQQGLDFNKDVKPLLGNEAVIGAPTVQALTAGNTQVIGALEVKDKGKLSSLLSSSSDLTKDGSSNGATLYKQKGGGETAQKGDVLLFADSKQQLLAALQQRGRNDRLTQDDFNGKLSGLPSDALVRLYVDAGQVINSSPGAAVAKRIKWVGALKTVGVTASSQSDGISLDFNAKTDSSQLSDSDLPIASGDASPPVASSPGEIGLGIRGLDQTERFAESIAQVVSPSSYSSFQSAKQQLGSALGINVDRDLIGQLSGNSTETFDLNGNWAVRAEPKDPAAFAKTLAKFARVAPSFAQGAGLKGARLTRSHGLYKLTGQNGTSIYYGMVGKVFAASNNASQLAQIASQSPQPVPGAKGAVALNADAGKLVSAILGAASGGGLGGSLGGSLFSAPLGSLSGWMSSSTGGLSGHLKLQIR